MQRGLSSMRRRWATGECWLWCERTAARVLWLGPVQWEGSHAPCTHASHVSGAWRPSCWPPSYVAEDRCPGGVAGSAPTAGCGASTSTCYGTVERADQEAPLLAQGARRAGTSHLPQTPAPGRAELSVIRPGRGLPHREPWRSV